MTWTPCYSLLKYPNLKNSEKDRVSFQQFSEMDSIVYVVVYLGVYAYHVIQHKSNYTYGCFSARTHTHHTSKQVGGIIRGQGRTLYSHMDIDLGRVRIKELPPQNWEKSSLMSTSS